MPEPHTILASATVGNSSSYRLIKSEKDAGSGGASLDGMNPRSEAPVVVPTALTLEQEVQQQAAARHSELEENSNTFAAYRRHYARYQSWWDKDQAERSLEAESANIGYCRVDALPITGVKVALFLEHERKRNRVCSLLLFNLTLFSLRFI